MPCFRVFRLFRGSLIFGDRNQSVIAGLGRFLNHGTHGTHGMESLHGYALFPCIRVVPWFHSVKFREGRASRQTELQCEFPQQEDCSWSGNSPRIAQQRNLIVAEDDLATAAGDLMNLCNENADHPLIVTNFSSFKSHLTRRLDPTKISVICIH